MGEFVTGVLVGCAMMLIIEAGLLLNDMRRLRKHIAAMLKEREK